MITVIVPEWVVWIAIGLMATHIPLLVMTIYYQKKEARARKWGGEIDISTLMEGHKGEI